jgi:prepilin-type N-terminal cleavage/methylation domain-containing protein
MRARSRRGFSFAEVLLTVALLSLLASMAIPNFMRARCKAAMTSCKENLKVISTAVQLYKHEHNGYPPPGTALLSNSHILMTSSYLKALPSCPQSNRVTYTLGSVRDGELLLSGGGEPQDGFMIFCGDGFNHHMLIGTTTGPYWYDKIGLTDTDPGF